MTSDQAIIRWQKYRSGIPLPEIYPLPPNWSETHEGDPDFARIQLLNEDAAALADIFISQEKP